MKSTFKVSLKANDRIYINGAVIRVDRKTSIEFLNDVSFLLEHHILQAEDANTPLKQLYYVVQIMLMAPSDVAAALGLFRGQMPALLSAFTNATVLAELKNVDRLVHEGSYFEAMKAIRGLFALEQEILAAGRPRPAVEAEAPRLAVGA